MMTFSITIDQDGFSVITNNIGQYIMEDELQKIINVAIYQQKMLNKYRDYAITHNQSIIDNITRETFNKSNTKSNYRKKISKSKRKKIFDLHGNKCLCCGTDEKICIDHIIPLFYGGTNDIDNLQPLCNTCNLRKKTKTIDYRKP